VIRGGEVGSRAWLATAMGEACELPGDYGAVSGDSPPVFSLHFQWHATTICSNKLATTFSVINLRLYVYTMFSTGTNV